MKRILTIDGGRVKGVFPVSFLATVEYTIDDSGSHYFDLIVGTSTQGNISKIVDPREPCVLTLVKLLRLDELICLIFSLSFILQ